MQGLGDPEFGDKCLHMTLEVWAMKEKQLISWTSLKFKTFALWKTFLGKEKDIHILGENIKKKKTTQNWWSTLGWNYIESTYA